MPRRVNQLDLVATDLAAWIETMSDQIAAAMLGGASAPFAARLTEAQKLEYYTRQLFNPDGSPNTAGRNQEIARLGPQGFRTVYAAVLKEHPELKPAELPDEEMTPTPLPGSTPHLAPEPPMLTGGAVPPGLPPGVGQPPPPGALPI